MELFFWDLLHHAVSMLWTTRALRLYSRPGYTKEILSASNGGVDVILEMLANVNLASDLELLRFRGRLVVSSASDTDPVCMSRQNAIV